MNHDANEIRRAVRERYARAATQEKSCCGPPAQCGCGSDADVTAVDVGLAVGYTEEELARLPDDANLGLGCGNPTALASLEPGQTVLDLGSGAGIDCFLAAERVGLEGRVIGVDMTPQMIEKARANAEKVGYANVEFRLGEIEALPVADASVDVVISNCVLNLSPDKDRVLAEAFRVLRPGGRVVISDLVSEREAPAAVANSLDAVAGCLPVARARYLDHLRRAGFSEVRITEEKPYPSGHILADPRVEEFLTEHPEALPALEAFARSISGAILSATRAR